jgi:membrane-associated HD superfamily phosphohydrolase
MRGIANVISVVFHPLLMPTYGCLLLFYGIKNTVYDFMTPVETKWRISLIVFVFTFVFPVLNIFVLYKFKRIPSLRMENQTERTFPYILTSLFYLGLFYLLKDISIWASFKLFILGAGIAILLTALINNRYKISAHMVGLGGLFGAILAAAWLIKFDMTLYYILIILIAGITAASRLYLNQHSYSQIYTGFILGCLIQVGLFFAFQSITFA